jgi:hypothetical protein
MKTAFLGLALIFISIFQTTDVSAQTDWDTTSPGNYKISKEEFLKLYAVDDTSKALIETYFKKRQNALPFIVLFGMSSSLEIFFIGAAITQLDSDSAFKMIIVFGAAALYTVCIFLPSVPLFILGIDGFSTYSRSNLYKDLINYSQGKGLRKHIKKLVVKKLSK